jgi:aldose 1-epimerase
VTGAFRCSLDSPENRPFWPADHEIVLTCRLGQGTLRLEAEVHNPDTVPLPFGLGYHPYFRLPFGPAGDADSCSVEVPAAEFWELEGNLPTGKRHGVDPSRDLNRLRRVGELHLDDVLTTLPNRAPRSDGLIERGLVQGGDGTSLRIFCSPAFREMVVFNPPHRQAFCIEPYTCPTDAANLQARDPNTGWLTLAPGQRWRAVVEYWI